eukprot:scaffold10926_cov163-Amphora_coffeaeformis.AAC.13
MTPTGQTYLYVKREEAIFLFDCRGKPCEGSMKSACLEIFADKRTLVIELQRLSVVGGGVHSQIAPTDVKPYTLVTMVARRR